MYIHPSHHHKGNSIFSHLTKVRPLILRGRNEGPLCAGHLEAPRALVQLLQCCKMLYEEGLPILYGQNVLSFASPSLGLQTMLPKHKNICAEVNHLFATNGPDHKTVHEMVTAMPKLKTFCMLRSGSTAPPERGDPAMTRQIKDNYFYGHFLSQDRTAASRQIELGILLCRPRSKKS